MTCPSKISYWKVKVIEYLIAARRLGDELRSLHSQFDMKLRDENAELYQAIGVHPILHQY